MYTTVIDGEDFAIKPMNCPGGILVYAAGAPLLPRPAPAGTVSWAWSTAMSCPARSTACSVSAASPRTTPTSCMTKDQIKDEVIRIVRLFDEVYSLFGLPYKIELSTMPEDHIGTREDWEQGRECSGRRHYRHRQGICGQPRRRRVLRPQAGLPSCQDSLGRTWQCGTIQLDYPAARAALIWSIPPATAARTCP